MSQTPLRPPTTTPTIALPTGERAKRRPAKWLWIAGGGLAALALGSGAYAVSQRDVRTTPAGTMAEGSFAFSVTGTRCGVEQVGPAALPARPTGRFCLVSVTVRNVGSEADLLDPGAQRAVDAQGRQYPVADQAAALLNSDVPTLLEEIAPGATVSGVLPFDVPADTALTAVELHSAIGSAGLRVPLS